MHIGKSSEGPEKWFMFSLTISSAPSSFLRMSPRFRGTTMTNKIRFFGWSTHYFAKNRNPSRLLWMFGIWHRRNHNFKTLLFELFFCLRVPTIFRIPAPTMDNNRPLHNIHLPYFISHYFSSKKERAVRTKRTHSLLERW